MTTRSTSMLHISRLRRYCHLVGLIVLLQNDSVVTAFTRLLPFVGIRRCNGPQFANWDTPSSPPLVSDDVKRHHDTAVTGRVQQRRLASVDKRISASSSGYKRCARLFASPDDSQSTTTEATTITPPSSTAPPSPFVSEQQHQHIVQQQPHSYEDAMQRTMMWVGAAMAFGGVVWALAGPTAFEEYYAGYLVEQSLSVDNLFVFLMLFDYFKVPIQYQDRVLNWGIYGAIIMRGLMIGVGAAAIQNFHAILLVFAAILMYGSAKFFIGDDEEEEDPDDNAIVKFARGLIQSTSEFDGDRFFTVRNGIRLATPLFICMIAVEISDVVFAVDSIPAVFGVTSNPLIVFSSNMFAIMGLRSLYTILSKAATDLKYLEPAVAVVLGFIGTKMVLEYVGYIVPTSVALAVVATLLGGGVGASIWEQRRRKGDESSEG